MSEGCTDLPYVFDLLYDIKTVEGLHAHLTGRSRFSTSGTDAELIAKAIEYDIPLPEGITLPSAALEELHRESLTLLELIYAKARRAKNTGDIDTAWLESAIAQALVKNGIKLPE